ncbi:MAG: signal peptidase I, partial [Woeseiaceae bacterium]
MAMQILLACTVFTGVVAILNVTAWRSGDQPMSETKESLVEFSNSVFPLVLCLVILQWFFGFTLALVLVVLTLYSGVVVLLNSLFWKKRNGPLFTGQQVLVEYSRSFFPVLLVVLVVRSFVFEPFRIPSGSMMPTLLQGDFIFVQKFAYGLRLPVTETKIFETGSPDRGDVIVFRLPQ